MRNIYARIEKNPSLTGYSLTLHELEEDGSCKDFDFGGISIASFETLDIAIEWGKVNLRCKNTASE